eukprot:PhM_4_TR17777/c0_g1_i1/m.50934
MSTSADENDRPLSVEERRKADFLRMKETVKFLQSSCESHERTILDLQKENAELKMKLETGGEKERRTSPSSPSPVSTDAAAEIEKLEHQIRFLHGRLLDYRRENTAFREKLGLGAATTSGKNRVAMYGPQRPPSTVRALHFKEQCLHTMYELRVQCSDMREWVEDKTRRTCQAATDAVLEMKERIKLEMAMLVQRDQSLTRELSHVKQLLQQSETQRTDLMKVNETLRTTIERMSSGSGVYPDDGEDCEMVEKEKEKEKVKEGEKEEVERDGMIDDDNDNDEEKESTTTKAKNSSEPFEYID